MGTPGRFSFCTRARRSVKLFLSKACLIFSFFFFSFWAWVCVCARVTRNKRFFRKPGDNTEPPFTRKRSKNRIGLLAVASRLNYQPFVTALLYNCRHDFPIFRGTFAISATELFGAIFLLIVRLQGEDKQRSVLFIFSF